ncbi:MAG: FHA domain-containing protein [Pirellulales bacterium]|nr:FHA domain-containing protein [Pirellulales bacterium]
MNVKLSVIKDGEVYKQLTVALPIVIGRGTEAGLTIKHPLVSREHCELFAADGSVQVKDLGSTNGTFVDEDPVNTPAVVATGSELKLGVVEMTVEFSEVLDAPSTAVYEAQELAAEVAAPETVQVDEDESVSAADNAALAEIDDFEVNNNADGANEVLDLGDFELNEDAASPAEADALDLGDFEVSDQAGGGEAVDEMPSLMDLANMADADVEAATSAEQPASPPEQNKTDDDDDDDDDGLQAFLSDLGG